MTHPGGTGDNRALAHCIEDEMTQGDNDAIRQAAASYARARDLTQQTGIWASAEDVHDVNLIFDAAKAVLSGDMDKSAFFATADDALTGMLLSLNGMKRRFAGAELARELEPLTEAVIEAAADPAYAQVLTAAIEEVGKQSRESGQPLSPTGESGIRPHLDRYLASKPQGSRGSEL